MLTSLGNIFQIARKEIEPIQYCPVSGLQHEMDGNKIVPDDPEITDAEEQERSVVRRMASWHRWAWEKYFIAASVLR